MAMNFPPQQSMPSPQPQGLPTQAPPPSALGAPAGAPDSPKAQAALHAAMRALSQFIVEEQDEQDKSVAHECLANLQKISQ